MRRLRLTLILAGLLGAVLCHPAASLAGNFTWNQPGDFTPSAPGANPDHDAYGATPWSYVERTEAVPTGVAGPTSRLPTFSPSASNGLAGWSDTTGEFVGKNPTSGPITSGGATFPPDRLAMTPGAGRAVALIWTSPLSHQATVTLGGGVIPAVTGGCTSTSAFSATVEQFGQPVQAVSGPFLMQRTVSPGEKLLLVIHPPALPLSPACATALVQVGITDSETAGPAPTLDSPANLGVVTGSQPTFSGHAAAGFGVAQAVTVRVYSGSGASGTPLQTVTAPVRSGGSYSVNPSSALADGTYTAQAEQDDLATPPDAGLSAADTFVVHNGRPTIRLASLGSKPLHTATPTLSGTADDATDPLVVALYPGSTSNARPVRFLRAQPRPDGSFSVRMSPALSDGQYTAMALQAGAAAGAGNFSAPLTFVIKLHPPRVYLASPANGQSTDQDPPTLVGVARSLPGDAATIDVVLYAGSQARGRPLGQTSARRTGPFWTLRWRPRLSLGRYTVVVTQADDAGHVGRGQSTFRIVRPLSLVGRVGVTRTGAAEIQITCPRAPGTPPASSNTGSGGGSPPPDPNVCTGDVLVLTEPRLGPLPGGPIGQVRVLFAHVDILPGRTVLVRRSLAGYVAQALRRARPMRVLVSVRLSRPGRSVTIRPLEIQR